MVARLNQSHTSSGSSFIALNGGAHQGPSNPLVLYVRVNRDGAEPCDFGAFVKEVASDDPVA
jgi:hypothetical protein